VKIVGSCTKLKGLETENNELKQILNQLQDSFSISNSNLEQKDSFLMEKESAFREKYQRLEDLYTNSKEIIDSYKKEMEDYKLEKDLLIKQLLEEKSRNQQERVSFSGQRTIFEETARKYEQGINEKEQKIKGLIDDLTQKEFFIRIDKRTIYRGNRKKGKRNKLENLLKEKMETDKRNDDKVTHLKEDSDSLRKEIKAIKKLNQKSNFVLEEK